MTEIANITERAHEQVTLPKPETTSEERTWAALAHASTIATMLISLFSGGIGGLLLVFAPFAIYMAYREKSRYVAYQAAQAFAVQILGTVGLLIAILTVILVIVLAWVITGLLSAILIGLVLIPVAAILTVALLLALTAVPFVIGAFSLIATVETANGKDYRYPYLGQWVAERITSYQTLPPAV